MTIACCVHNGIQNNGSVNGNAVVQAATAYATAAAAAAVNVFILLLRFRFSKMSNEKRVTTTTNSQFVTAKIDNESL